MWFRCLTFCLPCAHMYDDAIYFDGCFDLWCKIGFWEWKILGKFSNPNLCSPMMVGFCPTCCILAFLLSSSVPLVAQCAVLKISRKESNFWVTWSNNGWQPFVSSVKVLMKCTEFWHHFYSRQSDCEKSAQGSRRPADIKHWRANKQGETQRVGHTTCWTSYTRKLMCERAHPDNLLDTE